MNKCILPIDCVLAVTYRCNSRCTMCDIWKIKDFDEIDLSEFSKLPKTLRDINLSGGEPFLRTDLPEIVGVIAKNIPSARIVISSNGFATELIVKQMKKILQIKPDIGVAISIDGLSKMHDEIRGIKGGFVKATNTIKELQKLGMTNLRLGFTVSERNVKELTKVYELSRKLGVQFTHSFAQSSEFYFGGKQNIDFKEVSEEGLSEGMVLGHETDKPLAKVLKKQYKKLIKTELGGWNLKRFARAYYANAMLNFILSKNQPLSNAPGRDFFFMDPSGEIYPSVVHNFKMGNIKKIENDFEQFWCSYRMEEVREKIDKAKMPVWMICTARTAIKKHPFKVGWWVLKNKFF